MLGKGITERVGLGRGSEVHGAAVLHGVGQCRIRCIFGPPKPTFLRNYI